MIDRKTMVKLKSVRNKMIYARVNSILWRLKHSFYISNISIIILLPELILRNLDVLTNEETLLKEISNMSNIPIQSCQIARDTLTNLSRGICYLEMKNVLEAIKLYNALTASTLTVEGRKGNSCMEIYYVYRWILKSQFYNFSERFLLQITFRQATTSAVCANPESMGRLWNFRDWL